MEFEKIARHVRYIECLRCGTELAVRQWSEIGPGIFRAQCEHCGFKMDTFLMTPPTPQEPPKEPEQDQESNEWNEKKHRWEEKRAQAARENLRLLDPIKEPLPAQETETKTPPRKTTPPTKPQEPQPQPQTDLEEAARLAPLSLAAQRKARRARALAAQREIPGLEGNDRPSGQRSKRK